MSECVLVVGGGLAGLLAARRHQRAGRRVVLLEAGSAVGGSIAEERLAEAGDLAFSSGAEAYSTASGAVDALLAELGLGERTVAPREGLGSRLVSGAGVHRAPAQAVLGVPTHPLAADVRAVLGTAGALRAACERLLPRAVGASEGATVAEVIRRRSGRAVLERLVAPVVGGVHSADPASLEFAAASPALARGLREHGSLTAAVRHQLAGRADASRSAGTRVRSLTPTMAALPEALRTHLLAGGGIVRTGVQVVGVTRVAAQPDSAAPSPTPRWQLRTAGGETLEADHLVLACPPGTAAELLRETAPGIAAAIPQSPSAPVRLAALVVDCPALDSFPLGTGALVAPGTPGIAAKAITHVSAKWEHVQRALRTALPDAHSPHLLRLSYGRPGEQPPARDQLVDLALADASHLLGTPVTASQLRAGTVIDWEHATRGPGHRAALSALTALLAEQPTLELVGSWRAGTGIDAIVRAERTLTEGTAS